MHPPVSAKNFNDFSASLKGRTNHDSKFSFMQAFEKRDWGKNRSQEQGCVAGSPFQYMLRPTHIQTYVCTFKINFKYAF